MTVIEPYKGYTITAGTDAEGSYHVIKRNGASALRIYDDNNPFEGETALLAIKAYIDDEVSNKTSLEQLEETVDAHEAILVDAILEGVL